MPDACVVRKKYIPQEALKRCIQMTRRKLVHIERREGRNGGKIKERRHEGREREKQRELWLGK